MTITIKLLMKIVNSIFRNIKSNNSDNRKTVYRDAKI